ncbi:MAG: DUF192 domain-containing protein [Desulfocucumaceae bacterium]
MLLVNNQTGDVIADRAKIAGSFPGRLRGLLGKKTMSPGSALVLRPCRSIHTFFMKFYIDVIFLDRRGVVLHLIRSMPPSRLSPLVRGALTVVELPGGTIKERVSPGDTLILKEL